jgi:hypothetical protein
MDGNEGFREAIQAVKDLLPANLKRHVTGTDR